MSLVIHTAASAPRAEPCEDKELRRETGHSERARAGSCAQKEPPESPQTAGLPLPLPPGTPPPHSPSRVTYSGTVPPPSTHGDTGSASTPRGCTPRGWTRHPCRTRCGAKAASSLQAEGRTWGRRQPGRSPDACRPPMPLPASTLCCTRIPTSPRVRPSPIRYTYCICSSASGCPVLLRRHRPASEGPDHQVPSGERSSGSCVVMVTAFAWGHLLGLAVNRARLGK